MVQTGIAGYLCRLVVEHCGVRVMCACTRVVCCVCDKSLSVCYCTTDRMSFFFVRDIHHRTTKMDGKKLVSLSVFFFFFLPHRSHRSCTNQPTNQLTNKQTNFTKNQCGTTGHYCRKEQEMSRFCLYFVHNSFGILYGLRWYAKDLGLVDC